MKNAKHTWNDFELRLVLETVLKYYKIRDWSSIIEHLSREIGVSENAVRVLLVSYGRMSQGFEANPTKGGAGHNWGANAERAFGLFKSEKELSTSKLNVIFN